MSEFEIVKDYGEAKDKAVQIEILADLNMCSAEDILNILRKNGVSLPESVASKKQRRYYRPAAGRVEWSKENIERLGRLVADGLSLQEIASAFGTGVTAISKQISKHGLRSKKDAYSSNSIDVTALDALKKQLKDAEKEKKNILEEHRRAIADYTEIVVKLQEELAGEKEQCESLAAELHAFFDGKICKEIKMHADNIKGLAVLGLCAVGRDGIDNALRAAFLNIAESADVIDEELAKQNK